jgi:hypothetical protein
MNPEYLDVIQAALDEDSSDFTEEEANSAIETTSEDDFVSKVVAHLSKLAEGGASDQIKYQRKKRSKINYEVVTFGGVRATFKLSWLS